MGFIHASVHGVPRQSAGMLSFGPGSSVMGSATGDQQADAPVCPAAPVPVFRPRLRPLVALACAATGASAFAAPANAPEPAVTLPLWLFWLVVVGLLALGAALFAQTVRARRSLQRERLANRLIDHSPQLVCVLDPNGAMRHMNRTGRHWLRVTHPQIAGRRLDEIAELGIAETQALALQAVIAQAVGGTVVAHELMVKRPDGASLTLELSIRAIPRAGNVAPNLLVEGRDVTMRKAAEDKLHLAAAVFEQAREGFVIADRDGRVVTVNRPSATSAATTPTNCRASRPHRSASASAAATCAARFAPRCRQAATGRAKCAPRARTAATTPAGPPSRSSAMAAAP